MSIASNIYANALRIMGMAPTQRQADAIRAIAEMTQRREGREIVVIDGFAGTGKTTVVGAIIKSLNLMKIPTVLLAPTGRAAKVASSYAGIPGFTIHRAIYSYPERMAAEPVHSGKLKTNNYKNAVFFIDEASMIPHRAGEHSILVDLLRYVYSGPGCFAVLIGDSAQLPPVGQTDAPALSTDLLWSLSLKPKRIMLSQPLRQSMESGRLVNANIVRNALVKNRMGMPNLQIVNFDDIDIISSADLADSLASSYSAVGQEETLLITRSNIRANRYNEEIRARVLYAELPLQQGERLIISKNNYFWTSSGKSRSMFLANGETVIVQWVGHMEKKYGRWFVDVELSLPGYDEPIGAKIMLRSLKAQGPSVASDEMQKLHSYILAMAEGELTEKLKAADGDPYYNALQVKYGYAVTCHKSQGGQWAHVYIDMSGIDPANMTADFLRWLYTALTRATQKVFLINPRFPGD